MINYVNNAYDKVLKPCDAQRFSIIVNSQETERLILAHRGGDEKAKAKLPALTYMGVFDKDKYRETPSGSSQARLLGADKSAVVATDALSHRPCEGGDSYFAKNSLPSQGRGGDGSTGVVRPLGTRKAEFMRPTGLLMMDFDHHPNPRDIYDALLSYLSASEIAPTSVLALAHITPSGDGLRLVLKREKGKNIAQEQYEWFKRIREHYDGELAFDDVCKDISRLSFAPMQKEILYFNPSLLFGELPPQEDYPNNDLFETHPNGSQARLLGADKPAAVATDALSHRLCEGGNSTIAEPQVLPYREDLGGSPEWVSEWGSDFGGVPYCEIVARLEEQLGGRPERGARNSFIFTMACNLRYICDDNAEWVASILPTYGEEPMKHRMTIQSAINRPMSKTMPDTLTRALNICKMCSEGGNSEFKIQNSELAPELPSVLPEPIRLLTSRTPDKMKPAVAMGVFPSLGAYVKGTHFVYADGRHYEPTFMNVLVAEQSAGKSAVNTPVDYILADMKARDEVHLNQETEWKDKCSRISNTQDKPARPKGLVVQVLPSDMTNAAFVQRLADAEGHFLYTRMDEVELLNALKTNGSSNMVSAVLRLAFDCGEYGQVRVAANAINAMVRVRWNWNASSTVQRVRKYFAKNIADGTLSRLSFATIIEDDEDWGEEMPVYAEYDAHFADDLLRYIDRLKTCSGVLRCPEAVAWAVALNRELVGFAREADDRGYARMSRRGVLMGFFRAMLLFVMNGMQWSEAIEQFATWSVKYDLWCKMRFFRDMLRNDIEGERTAIQRGPVGLLPMLPKEFTREDVKALRIAQGMKPDPNALLRKWIERKVVLKDDSRGVYVKA